MCVHVCVFFVCVWGDDGGGEEGGEEEETDKLLY